MVQIRLVNSILELEKIKTLQNENLKHNIDDDTAEQEGFLSGDYSIDFLTQMHSVHPSVIAVDSDIVAGYALVTDKVVRNQHYLLDDLFKIVDKIEYDGILLKEVNYVVVGQLCVAKAYRGKGLAKQLYTHFKTEYAHQFKYCITDVAVANPRSLNAHLKTGFKIIDSLSYGGIEWNIVLWDWNHKH